MAFIARHDPKEEIAKLFKEVFDELATGGPRQYLTEIVKYITTVMESQSWTLKKQGGLTIKDLAEAVGSDIEPHLATILKLLVDGIPGRVWKGKESLLAALSAVCAASKGSIESGKYGQTPINLIELALKECKKNDKEYKRQAILCLSGLLKTFSNVNLYPVVKDQLFEIATEEVKLEADADAKDKPLMLLIKAATFQALGNAWPTDYETQKQFASDFVTLLVKSVKSNVWNVRVDILNAIQQFLVKVHVSNSADSKPSVLTQEMVQDIIAVLFDTLSDQKYSVIRQSALDALAELVNKTEGTDMLTSNIQEINTQLSNAINLDMTLTNKAEKIRLQLSDQTSKRRKNE